MKKVMFFLILILAISCKSQNRKDMLPTVDNKFEVFDTIQYKKLYNKNPNHPSETLGNGTYVEMNVANYGKSYSITLQNSYYTLTKVYFPNGNIKTKGAEFNEGSQVGIWYYFDESGKLVKEENTDEGYAFIPENVVRYCDKNKIELPKGYHESGFYTQVRKETLNGQRVWVIKYQDPAKPAYTNYSKNGYEYEIVLFETVILDGQTGKVLKVIPSDNFKPD